MPCIYLPRLARGEEGCGQTREGCVLFRFASTQPDSRQRMGFDPTTLLSDWVSGIRGNQMGIGATQPTQHNGQMGMGMVYGGSF